MRVALGYNFRLWFRALIAAGLVACFVLAGGGEARAQQLVLKDMGVESENGAVVLRFSLGVDDESALRNALVQGGALLLECRATLFKERDYWLDGDVAEAGFLSTLRSDPLTREFILSQPGLERPLRSKELGPLLDRAWGEIDAPLTTLARLEAGNLYYVEFEARLKMDDVPEWLKGTLFYRTWEVAPSLTYRMDFEY